MQLEGKIAVVAGATRGAGRGIACGLGEAGATVYCTGRSVRGQPATGDRPETIEETAEMVTARGGVGLFARVDHTDEEQVVALFERVRREQGRLDVLVNDIWGGEALTEWGKSFWQLSVDKGLQMMRTAIHTHIITSRHGVPLMLEQDRGLIVEITDGEDLGYRGNLFYDLSKTSAIRLAFAMSRDLRDTGLTAVALTPGFLRSEAMLELFSVSADDWRRAAEKDPHFLASETPFFVGRAVAALAADPDVGRKAGQALSSWKLAREYELDDVDGSRPDWGRHLCDTISAALRRAVGSRGVPAVADGEDRSPAVEQVRENVQRELGKVGLAEWLNMRSDDVYERILDLGPGADARKIAAFVEREFG